MSLISNLSNNLRNKYIFRQKETTSSIKHYKPLVFRALYIWFIDSFYHHEYKIFDYTVQHDVFNWNQDILIKKKNICAVHVCYWTAQAESCHLWSEVLFISFLVFFSLFHSWSVGHALVEDKHTWVQSLIHTRPDPSFLTVLDDKVGADFHLWKVASASSHPSAVSLSLSASLRPSWNVSVVFS